MQKHKLVEKSKTDQSNIDLKKRKSVIDVNCRVLARMGEGERKKTNEERKERK